jgi:hypothetical protein
VCESQWKHSELGHVCTGDLEIIENEELREVLRKGQVQREKEDRLGKGRGRRKKWKE